MVRLWRDWNGRVDSLGILRNGEPLKAFEQGSASNFLSVFRIEEVTLVL